MGDCGIIKIKMCQDLSDADSETYKLKIVMFENSQPKEFLALVNNFKTVVKINYLRTLLRGEALREFEKPVI